MHQVQSVAQGLKIGYNATFLDFRKTHEGTVAFVRALISVQNVSDFAITNVVVGFKPFESSLTNVVSSQGIVEGYEIVFMTYDIGEVELGEVRVAFTDAEGIRREHSQTLRILVVHPRLLPAAEKLGTLMSRQINLKPTYTRSYVGDEGVQVIEEGSYKIVYTLTEKLRKGELYWKTSVRTYRLAYRET